MTSRTGPGRRKALFAGPAFAALLIGSLLLTIRSFPRIHAGAGSGGVFAPSINRNASSIKMVSVPTMIRKQYRKYETETPNAIKAVSRGETSKPATVPSMLQTLMRCQTLECIKVAHSRSREPGTFNFPHFLIIGWQKTATTSLHDYLGHHKQINQPAIKEPEFFTKGCKYNIPEGCSARATVRYIQNTLQLSRYLEANGTIASYESSTHYSRRGSRIAADLYDTFPWVKIIMSVREPISRAASMLVHKYTSSGQGCLAEPGHSMSSCLLNYSQISGDSSSGPTEYYSVLKTWIDVFPRDQLFIVLVSFLSSGITFATSGPFLVFSLW